MNNTQRIANAIKWIDGLSKTKVEQGECKLGDSKSGYCCLGYGCKVLKIPYDPNMDVSPKFQKAVGLIRVDGCPIDDTFRCLTTLNDVDEKSFKQIAKILKTNPEQYFTKGVAKGISKHYTK